MAQAKVLVEAGTGERRGCSTAVFCILHVSVGPQNGGAPLPRVLSMWGWGYRSHHIC